LTKSPTSAASPVDAKSAIFTDLFSDDLFNSQSGTFPDRLDRSFTSPKISGSPDLKLPITYTSPEQLAKDDPLATQVWKMFSRTKDRLPHAQRMENLTWRMMALALKKKKEEDEAKALEKRGNPWSTNGQVRQPTTNATAPADSNDSSNERGRRIDKGKCKVRIVGFDGTNQDGVEDNE